MRLEIHINYSPSIIHLSEINSSIRNNKHYHGIYQNRVEMVIVCSLKIILTYDSWEFRLETLWEWIKENIELITIIKGQLKSLPIRNHQHYNGSQQDSGENDIISSLFNIFTWIILGISNWKYYEHKIKIIYIKT